MSQSVLRKILPVSLLLSLSLLLGLGKEEELFQIIKMQDSVYGAIAKPQFKLNCNAAIIINEDDVLIVDSHSKPSAAKALIKQIAKLTSNPVRYIINTHFHSDHVQGNRAFVSGYPHEVTIVSTIAARNSIIGLGIPRLKKELEEEMPATISKLKEALSKESDSGKRLELASNLNQSESYLQELKGAEIPLPEVTFDRSMLIHKKGRDIQLLFLGRGHTSGDAVIYLPKEKILATGDFVTGWVPGMGDGYPQEWIAALDEIAKLDIESVIGGHGDIGGKRMITLLHDYLVDLIAAVKAEVANGTSLEETRKLVLDRLAGRYSSQYPVDFQARVSDNVAKVYSDVKAGLY